VAVFFYERRKIAAGRSKTRQSLAAPGATSNLIVDQLYGDARQREQAETHNGWGKRIARDDECNHSPKYEDQRSDNKCPAKEEGSKLSHGLTSNLSSQRVEALVHASIPDYYSRDGRMQ
jgi:hypothetical protein